jgi:hypothetical protein
MRQIFLILFSFTSLLYSQTNWQIEWESPANKIFYSFYYSKSDLSYPDIILKDAGNQNNFYIYDGLSKQLKYNYTVSIDSEYWFYIPFLNNGTFPNAYTPIDVNNDNVNDPIIVSPNTLKVLNGINGQVLYQNSPPNGVSRPYTVDIDGDGYTEICLTTPNNRLMIISTASHLIAIEPNQNSVTNYSLQQNYPNPFNPVTTIDYSLSKDSDVKLIVYDILGREIGTFVNEKKKIGNYQIKFDGNNLASGTYFYQLIVDNVSDTKKMILIK